MKFNVAVPVTITTHEGGKAVPINALQQLRRRVCTCMLWEGTFYEDGKDIAEHIAELVPQVKPEDVAELAIDAREKMKLRHAPLLLARELARIKGTGKLVEKVLYRIIQRADELAEFCAIYWKDKRQPLSAAVKRGLAAAFCKFNEYQLAKYNRDGAVKLRDVLFLCHAKPQSAEQAALWKRLVDKTLAVPDTWEVSLSAGKDKKETFTRLLQEKKLGGLAAIRNLRNMQSAGVDDALIRQRLNDGIKGALPFQFVTAARCAPSLEDALEAAMFQGLADIPMLPGKTGLLVDVSGSMDDALSGKGEATRVDAAAGLAIMLRERAEEVRIATFSNNVVSVAPRRGFALRDAIHGSQYHSGTYLRKAIEEISTLWAGIDRLIVITDEQSADGGGIPFAKKSYVINVAPYRNGVGYRNGWFHIDGWSEHVFDFIREYEAL